MPIKVTRALLSAALNGSLRNADFRTDKYFGFAVPTSLPGVEPHILDPVKTWADKAEFDKTARALVGMFQKNFAKFEAQVDADVRAAAPEAKLAAEGGEPWSFRDAQSASPESRHESIRVNKVTSRFRIRSFTRAFAMTRCAHSLARI